MTVDRILVTMIINMHCVQYFAFSIQPDPRALCSSTIIVSCHHLQPKSRQSASAQSPRLWGCWSSKRSFIALANHQQRGPPPQARWPSQFHLPEQCSYLGPSGRGTTLAAGMAVPQFICSFLEISTLSSHSYSQILPQKFDWRQEIKNPDNVLP